MSQNIPQNKNQSDFDQKIRKQFVKYKSDKDRMFHFDKQDYSRKVDSSGYEIPNHSWIALETRKREQEHKISYFVILAVVFSGLGWGLPYFIFAIMGAMNILSGKRKGKNRF